MKWIYRNKWEARTIINDYSIGVNRFEYTDNYWIDWYQVSNPDNSDMSIIEIPKNINTLKQAKEFTLKWWSDNMAIKKVYKVDDFVEFKEENIGGTITKVLEDDYYLVNLSGYPYERCHLDEFK